MPPSAEVSGRYLRRWPKPMISSSMPSAAKSGTKAGTTPAAHWASDRWMAVSWPGGGPRTQRRRGGHERRALEGGIGSREGRQQGGMAGAEGREEVGVGRVARRIRPLAVRPRHGRGHGDVPGGPAMDVAGMPEEVLNLPGRARRDGGVQAGRVGRVGQPGALVTQSGDVRRDLHPDPAFAAQDVEAACEVGGKVAGEDDLAAVSGCSNARRTACSHWRVRPRRAASSGRPRRGGRRRRGA